jgi:hypothetical protein
LSRVDQKKELLKFITEQNENTPDRVSRAATRVPPGTNSLQGSPQRGITVRGPTEPAIMRTLRRHPTSQVW